VRRRTIYALVLCASLTGAGCGTYSRRGLEPAQAVPVAQALTQRALALSRNQEERILALDPNHVTGKDIREVLAHAPAPRIINIHGGVATVIPRMVSFSEFLLGMGYPGASITNPADGTYTFSCYESSDKIAGCIAWYYEQEGLRPALIGHSQGGFQVVKVLQKLAGLTASRLAVWNPLTWQKEDRHEIVDPLTGSRRPVVGLQVAYAASLGAGGLTRLLPNQWDMCGRLRSIPDSVDEFAGFYKGMDLLGGDFLGYGAANKFKPVGHAVVRNIALPSAWKHGRIPETSHLVKSQAIIDRINDYCPPQEAFFRVETTAETLDPETLFLPWAADVWYSLKKHWVLELQRRIRAQRAKGHGDG
jgi:hypothetical protein